MKHLHSLPILLSLAAFTLSCGHDDHGAEGAEDHGHPHADDDHGHSEGDEAPHTEGDEDHGGHDEDGEHIEVALGKVALGEFEVELAQGHGSVVSGKECHLVVRLPYSDSGSTVVRAWIGTEDRLAAYVGKGTYAPAHDNYDVHVTAPAPLPEGVHWWVELELPDGTKVVGSHAPILE